MCPIKSKSNGMIEMTKNMEIFENEEAERFLDYAVRYKKLAKLVDNVKCIAAINGEISLTRKEPMMPNSTANEMGDSCLLTSISIALEK